MSIFISYRRQGTADIAGRIADRLAGEFGRHNVVRDVDGSLPYGLPFEPVLRNHIQNSSVVLAIIGPNWIQGGASDTDFVRLEVAMALQEVKPVVPILVGGAEMPRRQELPPDLQRLVELHGISMDSGEGFDDAVRRLTKGLRTFLQPPAAATPPHAAQSAAQPAQTGLPSSMKTLVYLLPIFYVLLLLAAIEAEPLVFPLVVLGFAPIASLLIVSVRHKIARGTAYAAVLLIVNAFVTLALATATSSRLGGIGGPYSLLAAPFALGVAIRTWNGERRRRMAAIKGA